jgi:hypothetical protein
MRRRFSAVLYYPHFATKLWNITNFVMLFQAVMKFLSRLLSSKFWLIGEWSIDRPFTDLVRLFGQSLDLPQVSLEWVLIGYIQFIMRSVQNWSHNKLDIPIKTHSRETWGKSSQSPTVIVHTVTGRSKRIVCNYLFIITKLYSIAWLSLVNLHNLWTELHKIVQCTN